MRSFFVLADAASGLSLAESRLQVDQADASLEPPFASRRRLSALGPCNHRLSTTPRNPENDHIGDKSE
jgi:hypothetical protein